MPDFDVGVGHTVYHTLKGGEPMQDVSSMDWHQERQSRLLGLLVEMLHKKGVLTTPEVKELLREILV